METVMLNNDTIFHEKNDEYTKKHFFKVKNRLGSEETTLKIDAEIKEMIASYNKLRLEFTIRKICSYMLENNGEKNNLINDNHTYLGMIRLSIASKTKKLVCQNLSLIPISNV